MDPVDLVKGNRSNYYFAEEVHIGLDNGGRKGAILDNNSRRLWIQ